MKLERFVTAGPRLDFEQTQALIANIDVTGNGRMTNHD